MALYDRILDTVGNTPIVLDAERRGVLKPGQTIVEATSGNTGIALAMVAAARGYPFVAVMSDSFSVERRKLMRAYGAKVILTPAAYRGSTTGPEILRDFAGQRLDYFVSGWGTGGTITGAGEVLKLARPGIKV